jgi:hypothetical protein
MKAKLLFFSSEMQKSEAEKRAPGSEIYSMWDGKGCTKMFLGNIFTFLDWSNTRKTCKISSSDSGEYEDGHLMRFLLLSYRRFRGTSEISVNFCQTTRNYNPNDRHVENMHFIQYI